MMTSLERKSCDSISSDCNKLAPQNREEGIIGWQQPYNVQPIWGLTRGCCVKMTLGFLNLTEHHSKTIEYNRCEFEKKNKKKNTTRQHNCSISNVAVEANHRMNINKSEKFEKYQDIVRELRKIQNMKVRIVSLIVGVCGSLNWKPTVFLESASLLRKGMEILGNLLPINPQR